MSAVSEVREIPARVWTLKLGERIKWAREDAGLSHDGLVKRLGRSDRSHLIKIEKARHTPRQELRDALADALNVPRDLFADEPQEDPIAGVPFRGRADGALHADGRAGGPGGEGAAADGARGDGMTGEAA